jgi:peptidoglycan/LPS O-acetylase OafA/YrhL
MEAMESCAPGAGSEFYLFHLIMLGAMRTLFPSRAVVGDEKLLLLTAFFVLSAALSAGIARFYAEPLNRRVRRGLIAGQAAAITD